MTIKQLFKKVESQLNQGERILFQFFMRDLAKKFKQEGMLHWRHVGLCKNHQATAQGMYDLCLKVLFDDALELSHDDDDSLFTEATHISAAICDVLTEETGCQLEKIKIVSPVQLMIEAGLLELVTGPQGERLVKPTPKAEKMCQEMDDGLLRMARDKS